MAAENILANKVLARYQDISSVLHRSRRSGRSVFDIEVHLATTEYEKLSRRR